MKISIRLFLAALFTLVNTLGVKAISLNLKLVDSITNNPLAYAYAEIMDKKIGAITNDKGELSLFIPDSLINYRITFNSMGYETKDIAVSSLLDIKVIGLREKAYPIMEVVVRSAKWKVKTLGITKEFSNKGFLSADPKMSFYCLGQLMKNPTRKTGIIKNVQFYISEMGIYNMPFRIRIVAIKNGLPDNEVFNKDTFFVAPKKNAWISLDLAKLQIELPEEGYIAAMEWVYLGDKYYWERKIGKNTFRGYGQGLGNITGNKYSDELMYVKSLGSGWILAKDFYQMPFPVNMLIKSDIEVYD